MLSSRRHPLGLPVRQSELTVTRHDAERANRRLDRPYIGSVRSSSSIATTAQGSSRNRNRKRTKETDALAYLRVRACVRARGCRPPVCVCVVLSMNGKAVAPATVKDLFKRTVSLLSPLSPPHLRAVATFSLRARRKRGRGLSPSRLVVGRGSTSAPPAPSRAARGRRRLRTSRVSLPPIHPPRAALAI